MKTTRLLNQKSLSDAINKRIIGIVLLLALTFTCYGQEYPFNPSDYSAFPLPNLSIDDYNKPKGKTLRLVQVDLKNNTIDSFIVASTLTENFKRPGFNPHADIISTNDSARVGSSNYFFSNLQSADGIQGFPSYPFSAIVKLYVTMENGQNGTCSGVMIGPRHVATAGHCVYSISNGFLSNVQQSYVLPAYNNHPYVSNYTPPYGFATIINYWTFNAWLNNEDWNYDVAILELNQDIGQQVGWFGYAYNLDNNWYTSSNNTAASLGYPSQDDFGNTVFEGGERMYAMQGYMDFFESGLTHSVCHNNIGYHGQSGSGLYYKDGNGDRYVYGVLSHGNGMSPPYFTCHTRFASDVFAFFDDIISTNQDVKKDVIINVYPNPFIDYFMIELPASLSNNTPDISIINEVGQVIALEHVLTENGIRINTSALPKGNYFIQLKTKGEVLNHKIIKL